jgi:hypothetical protein
VSPEEEERYYSMRESVVMEENGKVSVDVSNNGIGEERGSEKVKK